MGRHTYVLPKRVLRLGAGEEPTASLMTHLLSLDEDLIRQVLAEGVRSLAPTQDTQVETDLLTGL